MNYIELLLQAQGRLFVLECARISGVIVAAPMAWLNAPLRIRAALVLMLAFVVHGTANATHVPNSLLEVAWVTIVEFALGGAMGLVVRFIVAMAEVAAEAIAPMLGLGVGQLFDAASNSQQNILTSILRNLSILLALAIGVHRLLLQALLEGFRVIPVGTVSMPAAGLKVLWELSGQVLLVGTRIALPIVAILFIVQLTLAFVSRAAPQLQIFSVGFTVATVVGLIALILVLPDISRGFIVEHSKVASHLGQLFVDLGAAQ